VYEALENLLETEENELVITADTYLYDTYI
jgi:hypothetical protein